MRMINVRAFDAHNHIHLSLKGGIPPLIDGSNFIDKLSPSPAIASHSKSIRSSLSMALVGGIALMSTQNRDFPIVYQLSQELSSITGNTPSISEDNTTNHRLDVVRCYGVHPWFLNQAKQDIINLQQTSKPKLDEYHAFTQQDICEYTQMALQLSNANIEDVPWLPHLCQTLLADPSSHVGEFGLDGARYDPITKDLVCQMKDQIVAFEVQMHIAAMLKRSVSIHAVRCWGPLMEALKRVKMVRSQLRKEQKLQRKNQGRTLQESQNGSLSIQQRRLIEDDAVLILPPKIYWHAFGGKTAVVRQLDAICRDCSEIFYGFAPVINFRSYKTTDLVREIGIHRLVLESDLEDFSELQNDIKTNIKFIAESLEMNDNEVIYQTTKNAKRLYAIEV